METKENLISEGDNNIPNVNKVENDKLTLKVKSETQNPKESDRNELIQNDVFEKEKTKDNADIEKEKKAEIEKQKKVEADKQKKLEEEKKKEEERKKEEEKKKKEEQKNEEEKKKKEEKQKKDEEEKKKKEEEKKKKEEEKKKKEEEKKKKEEEKKKKEEEEKKKKEEEEKKKKEEEKKKKYPIIPYKVSKSHSGKLLAALSKKKNLRPTSLLCPETDDITSTIDLLDGNEEEQNKKEEAENKNFEDNEKEDKIFQGTCRDSSLTGDNNISDPIALFDGAEKAYIDQFYKLSDLFVICPLYFNYRISLEYKINSSDYAAYHLFNTKEISPLCSHNCCANQARQIDINIFNFIVDPKYPSKTVQKFIKLKKNCRCALGCFCACCSRPTFSVETVCDQIGYIVEAMGCNPVIQVLDINKDVIFEVKARYCDCGFCLRDQCCDARACAKCAFFIYDTKNNSVGTITKDHRSGKKVKPDYDQLAVVFPAEISCQNKILLTCSALVIEYLYFQHMTNVKRCCGNPKYINSYQTY